MNEGWGILKLGEVMKCLVVVAHPLEDSLCLYLAKKTVAHLQAKGHEVTVKNLYEERFDPVLSAAERASYYTAEFDDERLQKDIAELKAAEMLVLVFPTWWYGFPAILKGWFDRVWAPGHAYLHADDNTAIKPNLSRLKQFYAVTTLGSPKWVDLFVMWKPVSRILRLAIAGTCAKGCKFKMLSLYNSEALDELKVVKFVEEIERNF